MVYRSDQSSMGTVFEHRRAAQLPHMLSYLFIVTVINHHETLASYGSLHEVMINTAIDADNVDLLHQLLARLDWALWSQIKLFTKGSSD
jgi:hypothetical protein